MHFRCHSFAFPTNASQKSGHEYRFNDSLPKYRKDTVVVPFEYKQSALYQPYTLLVIDSAVDILLKMDSVKLSIDGFAFVEEGTDSICYYLSLNRALAVRDYVIGRGVDSTRIIFLKGWGNTRSKHRKINDQVVKYNCRAELLINYPLPPPPPVIQDRDEDGIADADDQCPDEYGEKDNNGCPNRNAIIIPFEAKQYAMYSMTYNVLDSVIAVLLKDPSITVSIDGHAYKTEGNRTVCEHLAIDRADIVRNYLLTRRITASRIESVKSFGYLRPLNAGKTPKEITRNSRAEIYLIHH